MKLIHAPLTLLILASGIAYGATNKFDRTLNTSAQPDLYVQTGSGDITILPSDGNQVHIIGHVHAGWAVFSDVTNRIDRIVADPPISQSGNEIHVGEPSNRDLLNNVSIDYQIYVPTAAALNVHTGSGDIVINQVGRYLSASSGSGDIKAHGIHGPSDLRTGSGDITLVEDGAGDVKAKTGSGSINIQGLSGNVMGRSGSGNITIAGHLSGAANVSSGSGDIKLRFMAGDRFNLEASTGSGDMHVNYPGAPKQNDESRHHLTAAINGGGPPLEVRTGSGNVEIDAQ